MSLWDSKIRLQRLLLGEILKKAEDLKRYDNAVTDTFPLKPKKEALKEWKKQREEAIRAIVEKKPKVQLAVSKAIQEVKSFEPAPYIFVSADGDNIGSTVEQKVMANDLEGIIRQSELIKQGQAFLKSSFETLSGKLLVHGGDDSLAVVGSEHLDKIEKIRQGYHALTNFTITFGVGNTMREAVKAMVYGKLTGKDKLVFWDDSLNEKLQELAHEQTPGEKLTEHGLLPGDIAEKAESLQKEIYGAAPEERKYALKFHGWISPKGEFHPMKASHVHAETAAELADEHHGKRISLHSNPWAAAKFLYHKGWISMGHGGQPTLGGHSETLANPNHPATRKATAMIRELPSETEGVNVINEHHLDDEKEPALTIPRHLAEKGVFKQPRLTQLYRSEELSKCEPGEIEGVKEYLVGGFGDGHPSSEFDPKEVEMGIKVEMEHTNNPEISEEITRDHLAEIPDYYTRLDAMEEQAKKDGKFREVVKGKPGEKSTIQLKEKFDKCNDRGWCPKCGGSALRNEASSNPHDAKCTACGHEWRKIEEELKNGKK